MGTRGLMAFTHNGEVKGMYNHWDSYPTGLGKDIVKWILSLGGDFSEAIEQFKALVPVKEDQPPTQDQQLALLRYFDDRVSTRRSDEWYALLRHTQGDPAEALKAGFYIDGTAFAKDSLFCEYGYVVDLDKKVLEVYKGFQTKPHSEGRFADGEDAEPTVTNEYISSSYYPIKLIKTYTLADLEADEDAMDHLEEELDSEEDDD